MISIDFIFDYFSFHFFVNVMFGFDLWLPCFLSILTFSDICLILPDNHIGSITSLKKRKEKEKVSNVSYFFCPHCMNLMSFFLLLLTSSCLYVYDGLFKCLLSNCGLLHPRFSPIFFFNLENPFQCFF